MIKLSKFQGKESKDIYINSDLIESIEEVPDTILTLVTGKKIVVEEDVEEVVKRIIEFRKEIGGIPRVVSREVL